MRVLALAAVLSAWGVAAAQSQDQTQQGSNSQGSQTQEKLEPINTDRPSIVNNAFIVPVGHPQIEAGYLFTRGGPLKLQEFGDSATLRVALDKRFEARLQFPSYAIADDRGRVQGFESTGVGFKWQLAIGPEKFRWSSPSLALSGLAIVPSGSKNFRSDRVQPFAFLYGSWEPTGNDDIDVGLGLGALDQGGQSFNQFQWQACYTHQFTDKWSAYGEFFGFDPNSPSGPNQNGADVGLLYLVNNDFQLDLRFGQVFQNPQPNYFVGVGFGYRW